MLHPDLDPQCCLCLESVLPLHSVVGELGQDSAGMQGWTSLSLSRPKTSPIPGCPCGLARCQQGHWTSAVIATITEAEATEWHICNSILVLEGNHKAGPQVLDLLPPKVYISRKPELDRGLDPNPDTPIGDAGIPSGILTGGPNAYPWINSFFMAKCYCCINDLQSLIQIWINPVSFLLQIML